MPWGIGWAEPVPWPAMSGKGARMDYLRSGTQSDNLNFFDPTRPEFTPNAVYYAFRDAFDPMPPLREVMDPEVIVTVPAGGRTDLSVWVVGSSLACPQGVLPDKEGRAWFHLPAAGDYTALYDTGSTVLKADFHAETQPLKQPPGFDYIQRVSVGQ